MVFISTRGHVIKARGTVEEKAALCPAVLEQKLHNGATEQVATANPIYYY